MIKTRSLLIQRSTVIEFSIIVKWRKELTLRLSMNRLVSGLF